jgi:hypothetical protein
MPDFAAWLRTRVSQDPDAVTLQTFARSLADWPWWSDSLADYIAVIQTASPPNKDELISAVSVNYGRWEAERDMAEGLLARFGRHAGIVFLALFGVITASAIFYGLFLNQSFFTLMAKTDQARGLITFLFAFATIAIIILIAITTFWMPKEEVDARFNKAKDLLTIIIGVLGTILGFYFGQTISGTPSAGQTAIGLRPVGETPKLETGWPNAGLRQLRVKRYRQ